MFFLTDIYENQYSIFDTIDSSTEVLSEELLVSFINEGIEIRGVLPIQKGGYIYYPLKLPDQLSEQYKGWKHLGEVRKLKCGQFAMVIEYMRGVGSCKILFEDRTIVDASYSSFSRDSVKNPNKYIGERLLMNNGMYAEIIEKITNSHDTVKVRFEDGFEKVCKYTAFKHGSVANPNIDNRSSVEKLVAYFIGKYFDIIPSYNLCRYPISNQPCEVDIWVPVLKTVIEYDGIIHSFNYRENVDNRKDELLCASNDVFKVIRIREFGNPELKKYPKLMVYNTERYIHISRPNSLEHLKEILIRILKDLGIKEPRIEITEEVLNAIK